MRQPDLPATNPPPPTHRPRIRTHDRLISHEGQDHPQPTEKEAHALIGKPRITVAAAPKTDPAHHHGQTGTAGRQGVQVATETPPAPRLACPCPAPPRLASGPRMQAWLRGDWNWNWWRGHPTSISMMQHLLSPSAFLYPAPLPFSTSHTTSSSRSALQRPSPRPVWLQGVSDRLLGPTGHQRGSEPPASTSSAAAAAAASGGLVLTRTGLLYSSIRPVTTAYLTHPGALLGHSFIHSFLPSFLPTSFRRLARPEVSFLVYASRS